MPSSGPIRNQTLQLTRPFGQALISTLAALIVVSGCSEAATRTQAVQSALPMPTINGYDEIGAKLMYLDRLAAESGPPDCIVIGSSMVDMGVNPDSIEQAYQQKTGSPLSCFNFGLSGLEAESASKLAVALTREYHPRLLIYGQSFRDYINTEHSLNNSWIRYYLGSPTLEGWLETHSYAYRYALSYRAMLREPPGRFGRGYPIDGNGLMLVERTMKSPEIDLPDRSEYAQWSANYEMLPHELAGLESLLALDSPEQQIVLLEMPLAPGTYAALPNGESTYSTFVSEVARRAAARGVPFWLSQDRVEFSRDDWFEPFHLNAQGADTFGRWLGEQIADAVQRGQIRSPNP